MRLDRWQSGAAASIALLILPRRTHAYGVALHICSVTIGLALAHPSVSLRSIYLRWIVARSRCGSVWKRVELVAAEPAVDSLESTAAGAHMMIKHDSDYNYTPGHFHSQHTLVNLPPYWRRHPLHPWMTGAPRLSVFVYDCPRFNSVGWTDGCRWTYGRTWPFDRI